MSSIAGIGAVGSTAHWPNRSLSRVRWIVTSCRRDVWRRRCQRRRERSRRRRFLHDANRRIARSWWSAASYSRYKDELPAFKHTTINKHTNQKEGIVKTRKNYCYYYFHDYFGHDVSTNRCARSLPVVMVVPPMQSIGLNSAGKYTRYMIPRTTCVLGLPCHPSWRAWRLKSRSY